MNDSSMSRRIAAFSLLALFTGLSVTPWELHGQSVLPTNPNVVSGTASVSTNGSAMQVVNSNGAVINWDSFSIGASNSVNFLQSGADSSVLNRVVGHNLSEIYGSLTSNGKVFLINQNGIFVGANATINTAGFLASTLDISNAEFKANNGTGTLHFIGNSEAAITNLGTINAVGGDVYLIAKHINNSGSLSASEVAGKGGIVGAYATDELYLTTGTPNGGLVRVGSGSATGTGTGIDNSGLINAVQADLKATGNLYAMAINNTGVIRATGASVKNGVVHLGVVGGAGKIVAGGEIHADGTNGGGEIDLSAADDIDVSGLLTANATTAGNGGAVKIVSGSLTHFSGHIEAKGAGADGQGGNAEVSGADLKVTGFADLSGAGGNGTLLFDPGSITILSVGAGSGDNVNTFTDAYLNTQLGTANVTLATSSATNGAAQTITLNSDAALNWTSASTLTLNAGSDIALNGSISASSGGLTLNSGGTITAPGSVSVKTFTLQAGSWVQNAATLPSFYAGDFRINGGSFLRVLSGSGTSANPYLVGDVYGLQGIGSSNANLAANWKLANNIDASGTSGWNGGLGWTPIAKNSIFIGTLDGGGYAIDELYINNASLAQVGLFDRIDSSGTVENLGLTEVNITGGTAHVGALAGSSYGAVSFVYATGTVTGGNSITGNSAYIGGLVGYSDGGSILNSSAAVTVTGGTYAGVGGFIGYINSDQPVTVVNSHATGNVVGGVGSAVGGFVGVNWGSIESSYATGNVTGASDGDAGGFAGSNGGTIAASSAAGSVGGARFTGGFLGYSGSGSVVTSDATGEVFSNIHRGAVGGFVGYMEAGEISSSYAQGNVIGGTNAGVGGFVGYINNDHAIAVSTDFATGNVVGSAGAAVGGFVGVNWGSIANSYAVGNVTGASDGEAGGFAGGNGATIATSYSAGSVAGATYIGGFVGYNNGGAVASTTYWNTTRGGSVAVGLNSGGTVASVGLSDSQMKQHTNFVGFDFTNMWQQIDGASYPLLRGLSAIATGTAYSDNGVTNVGSGVTITVYDNGALLGTTVTGAGGTYQFSYAGFSSGELLLSDSGGVTVSAAGTGINLWGNTVMANAAGNSLLAQANPSGQTSLYTVSGNDIIIGSGVNFVGSGGYTLGGNLTASGSGTITFTGAVTQTANATVSGASSIGFNNLISAGSYTTTITSSTGTVSLSAVSAGGLSVSGAAISLSAGTIATGTGGIALTGVTTLAGTGTTTLSTSGNIALAGSLSGASAGLTLNAGGTITETGDLSVKTFTLQSGNWVQNAAVLPSFYAGDFRINGGSFLRVLSGSGTSASPYLVGDVYCLQGIGSSSTYLAANWKLANNIDASGTSGWNSGAGFVSIGQGIAFSGSLNGSGFTVSSLFLHDTSSGNVGLVAQLSSVGAISGLGLIGVDVAGGTGADVGALVGRSLGFIDNSYATGAVGVGAGGDAGGLVAYNEGMISSSYSQVNVTANGGSSAAGGLAGYSSGVILNSHAGGTVTGASYSGGLAGYVTGSVSSSYATGNVSANSGYDIGGLIGRLTSTGSVDGSYATGAANAGAGGGAGGLISYNEGTISNSYALGNVTVNGGSSDAGGLVAYNSGSISSSYATGSATGASYTGGFVGRNQGGAVVLSYANGSVSSNTAGAVGGFVGYMNGGSISKSYATGSAVGSSNIAVGGFVGVNQGSISNSYALGSVAGATGGTAGGFVGSNGGSGSITLSYAAGGSSGADFIGGFAGYNNGGTIASTTYWDTTAGGSVAVGLNAGGTVASVGLSDSQMKQHTNFVGFDFTNVWQQIDGATYPLLRGLSAIATGTAYSDNGVTNVGSGVTITVYDNGALLGTTVTGAGGAYQFSYAGFSSGELLLSDSGGVTVSAAGTGINLWGNTVMANAASNSLLAQANPSGQTALYSVAGNDVTIASGVNFVTVGGYTLNGNVATSGSGTVTLGGTTTVAGNFTITAGGALSAGAIALGANTVTLASGGNMALNGAVSGSGGLVVSSGGTISDSGSVSVGSFTLQAGDWVQNNASLPSFSAGDFTLAGGSFLRVVSGSGTSASPYQVADVYGLQGIGSSSAYLGSSWKLANDIDASGTSGWNGGAGFVSIGQSTASPFAGTLDGNGHSVSGLHINDTASTYVGLVGENGLTGVVKNIAISGGSVTGGNNAYVGPLVGENRGLVDNASASATVVGGNFTSAGGLVGGSDETTSVVSNSHASSTVTAGTNSTAGGLLGYSIGTVTGSYATGAVTGGNETSAGGLVGKSDNLVENSYATGTVVGGNNTGIGGLVGYNAGTVTTSRAAGSVSGGTGASIGGLVGSMESSSVVSQSYATGSVSGGTSSLIGGLVGYSPGTIETSFATSSVTGLDNTLIGGLVGLNQGGIANSYATGSGSGGSGSTVAGLVGGNSGTIATSYSTGSVSGANVAGLIGYNYGGHTTVTDSYWNVTSSGIGTAGAVQNGATGRTTAWLQTQANYPSTWDFTSVWTTKGDTTAPVLQWQP